MPTRLFKSEEPSAGAEQLPVAAFFQRPISRTPNKHQVLLTSRVDILPFLPIVISVGFSLTPEDDHVVWSSRGLTAMIASRRILSTEDVFFQERLHGEWFRSAARAARTARDNTTTKDFWHTRGEMGTAERRSKIPYDDAACVARAAENRTVKRPLLAISAIACHSEAPFTATLIESRWGIGDLLGMGPTRPSRSSGAFVSARTAALSTVGVRASTPPWAGWSWNRGSFGCFLASCLLKPIAYSALPWRSAALADPYLYRALCSVPAPGGQRQMPLSMRYGDRFNWPRMVNAQWL